MTDEDFPIEFVAMWGLFAFAMLFGHIHLINHGAHAALSFLVDEMDGPINVGGAD